MTKAQAQNIASGKLYYMQFISTNDTLDNKALEDTDTLIKALKSGDVVRVRPNQSLSAYEGTDTTVYKYIATEGSGDNKREIEKYAVAISDAVRSPRASVKDKLKALKAQGMTAEEILAQLLQ